MIDRLSSETIHASSVARDGRVVLITGPSGAGKSDLALRLIDRGFQLVSDDQTMISKAGVQLLASAPATIRGKLEIRGVGIVIMAQVDGQRVALIVELASEIERLPDEGRERRLLGVPVPLIQVDARTASAAVKVALALDQFGVES